MRHPGLQVSHGYQDNRIKRRRLTKIDAVDTEEAKALGTGFLAVLSRRVDSHGLAALNEAKLGRKEDLVALPRPLEPLAQELLAIAVKAMICIRC